MKLIFLDIDGTLVLPGMMEPSPAVLEAIRAAQKNGHKVFLSTGRSRCLLDKLLPLGFDGCICSAGGTIFIGEEKIFDCPIPEALALRTRQAMSRLDMGIVLECENATFGAESFGRLIARVENGSSETERWKKNMMSNKNVFPASAYDGQPIYKICFATTSTEALDTLRPELEENFKICMFDFRPYMKNGEIIYKAFNKGKALETICRYYGVPVSDTIAIGDSANDAEMVEAAGVGVAMENGTPALKALADYICPTVQEDGVAKAFAHLGLI